MTTPGTLSDAWADDQEIDFLPPKPTHAADAVDRVAQELVRIYSLGVSWDGASESLRAEWRKFAQRVLDAAGLHEAVAQPVAVPAQALFAAMAERAELTSERLAALPRKLLDVACRIRTNETLHHDDDIVDFAAHAIKAAALAAAPTQEPT